MNYMRGFSNLPATSEPTFHNNYYYASSNLIEPVWESQAIYFDTNGKAEDPQFADAENGDFTPWKRSVIENLGRRL